MTSQHLLNLEYLRRATDPRIPEPERQEMLESLSYAMSKDEASDHWVIETFTGVAPEALPDPMILWLADWAEFLPPEQATQEVRGLIVKLWLPQANPTTQARLFECVATLDRNHSESDRNQVESSADYIFAHAISHDAEAQTPDCVLALLDMVLSRSDTHLLSSLAGKLNERGMSHWPSVIALVERRLPVLPDEFRRYVAKQFGLNE